MDEGPFRMPQRSVDRNDNDRHEPTERHTQYEEPKPEPKPARKESRPVQRGASSHHLGNEESPLKRFILPVVGVVVVLGLVVGGWVMWSGAQNAGTGIDGSKYQAVFFTNGQVYFGKLQQFNDEYMKMTDIYYLQTPSTDAADSKNPQKTATDAGNPTLIKLGEELHGPEDTMIISKQQVLFYENLKKDGKVAQSIEKFKHPN